MPVVLFTVVALSAAGCGKQQDTPAAPALAPQGAPPVTGVAPAPNAAPEPSAGLEALLRDRATRYAPSALWKNRLGRFLLARGQGDEAALLLEAAAAADPGNADFRLDALLIRASRAGSMQGPDVAQVSALLGEPAPHAQGAVAGSAAVGPANSMAPPLAPAPPGAAVAPQAVAGAAPHTPPGLAAQPPVMPGAAPEDPQAAAVRLAPVPPVPAAAADAQPGLPGVGAVPPEAPPASFEAAATRARAAVQKGDLAQAGAMWQEALRFDGQSAEGWLGLADVTLMRGESSAAIGHYKEALRLAPQNAVVAKRLGDACFQARQSDCAFSAYEVATAGEPVSTDGYVWVRWAHVANQLGKRAVAEKALAAAEKLLPSDDRDLATVRSLLSVPGE